MATRWGLQHVCKKYLTGCIRKASKLAPTVCWKLPSRCLLTVPVFAVNCQAKQKLNLQGPDKDTLNQEYLLKAAAANTADAVTVLLNRSTHMLVIAEQKSVHAMVVLIQLLDYHTTVLDIKDEADRVWDLVLEARARLQATYDHIKELEQLHSCIEVLVDASAEVAFLTESEFSGTSLGERLHNTRCYLSRVRNISSVKKTELQETEDHNAEVRSNYAELMEKQKQAEDALFGEEEEVQSSSESDDENLHHDAT